MKIDNLKEGMIIKNYKEMCKILDEPMKTGNSKKAQLKEWQRYFSYEKQNYSFIIKKIYELPLPPNNNITNYIPLIEKLILHYIVAESENNILYIPKGRLLKLLKMINNEYSIMKYRKMQLSKQYNIPKETIIDFYNTSDDLLERNIVTALNSLKNQSLIKWNYVYSVVEVQKYDYYEKDDIYFKKEEVINNFGDTEYKIEGNLKHLKETHRRATDEETEYILKLQRELLEEWDIPDISTVIKYGKGKEFFDNIKQQLWEERGISNYYDSFELIYNFEHIVKQYNKVDIFLLDETNKEILGKRLNKEIFNKLIENGKDRHRKALEGKGSFNMIEIRKSKNYIEDTIKLTNKLIKTEPYNYIINNKNIK